MSLFDLKQVGNALRFVIRPVDVSLKIVPNEDRTGALCLLINDRRRALPRKKRNVLQGETNDAPTKTNPPSGVDVCR